MHNAPKPNIEDLPTLKQLSRSTIIAAISAFVIWLTVYQPAEYGNDPTGVGSILGLTEMGEIKQQLAKEAAEDKKLHGDDKSSSLSDGIFSIFVSKAQAQEVWKDEVTFTLAPGTSAEIKATMAKGAALHYAWVAEGGLINFDLHSHNGDNEVSYDKGRGQASGKGSIETPFAGDHGWFWRNRDKTDVTVTLQLHGDYSAIVRDE